jgi:hypothetical protein
VTTFKELVDSTLLFLSGYSSSTDASTYLTSATGVGGLSFTVNNPGAISTGVAELGDELVLVDTVDSSSGTVTVAPFGRGYRSTVAVAHAYGDQITQSPMFPRVSTKRAINETLRAVYPLLFGIGQTSFQFIPSRTTFALPVDCERVLAVAIKTIGPSGEWVPVRRYRVDQNANTTQYPTGVTISLYEGYSTNMVNVTYASKPQPMTADTDLFSSTGLADSCEDVVRLGAAHRLIPFLDSPHAALTSSEANFSAGVHQSSGPAQALARYFMQNYQMRLQEEATQLRDIVPVRTHYTS